MNLVSDATRSNLAQYHPEVVSELTRLEGLLSDGDVDQSLLQLCSDYIRASLTNTQRPESESAGSLEQACLAFCDQFMVSVANVSDQQITALGEHLSTDTVYNFINAVYLIEMSHRLDLALERLVP